MSKLKVRVIQTITVIALCTIAILFAITDYSSCLSSCAPSQGQSDRVSETRVMLGTYCTITIGGTDEDNLIDKGFSICQELESLLSMNVEGSDVWRINNAKGQSVAVSPDTIEAIARGIEFGELSEGMFDITIGRLSSLWDFGGEASGSPGRRGIPEQSELERARMTVDYKQIEINTDDNTVRLSNTDAWLDLGAIAKGYIADKIAEFLVYNGVESAIIDLGGDIVVIGNRPDGGPWRLGIQKPFSEEAEITGIMEYSNASVVSSGIYERQFVHEGVRYHHILDPNTAMPAQSDVVAATIISYSAATGEGVATIIVLLGSERAQEIFDKVPGFVGAVLLLEDESIRTYGEVSLELAP